MQQRQQQQQQLQQQQQQQQQQAARGTPVTAPQLYTAQQQPLHLQQQPLHLQQQQQQQRQAWPVAGPAAAAPPPTTNGVSSSVQVTGGQVRPIDATAQRSTAVSVPAPAPAPSPAAVHARASVPRVPITPRDASGSVVPWPAKVQRLPDALSTSDMWAASRLATPLERLVMSVPEVAELVSASLRTPALRIVDFVRCLERAHKAIVPARVAQNKVAALSAQLKQAEAVYMQALSAAKAASASEAHARALYEQQQEALAALEEEAGDRMEEAEQEEKLKAKAEAASGAEGAAASSVPPSSTAAATPSVEAGVGGDASRGTAALFSPDQLAWLSDQVSVLRALASAGSAQADVRVDSSVLARIMARGAGRSVSGCAELHALDAAYVRGIVAPYPVGVATLLQARDDLDRQRAWLSHERVRRRVAAGTVPRDEALRAAVHAKGHALRALHEATQRALLAELRLGAVADLAGPRAQRVVQRFVELRVADRFEGVRQVRAQHERFLDAVMQRREAMQRQSKAFAELWAKVSQDARARAIQLLGYNDPDVVARRQQLERMEALKRSDFDKYLELLEKSKNDRIQELVGKVEGVLRTLAEKIERQRTERSGREPAAAPDSADAAGVDAAIGAADTEDAGAGAGAGAGTSTMGAGYSRQKAQLMSLAARVREELVTQPTMLQGGKLREFQMVGLSWMISLYNNNLNGILADEMGLGKTIQTIALVAYLMQHKGNNGPHLIVVPSPTLANWKNEFEMWLPMVRVVTYSGEKPVRKQIVKDNFLPAPVFNVCLTTYPFVISDKRYLGKVDWNYVIVDEAHHMKNRDSKLSTTLTTSYRSLHRLLLTGTPLQNNLSELWSLLNFVLPDVFDNAAGFNEWFSVPFSAQPAADKATDKAAVTERELNQEQSLVVVHSLHLVLGPFILRRTKSEVATQLPSKTEHVVWCNLSAWQRMVYEQISVGKVLSSGVDMQLRKICVHPYVFHKLSRPETTNEEIVRASGKFELLDRVLPKLHESGHRVLIFSQFTMVLDVLEEYVLYRGYKYARFDGSVGMQVRQTLVDQFNAKDSTTFVFLLTTGAGGTGLNLQSADTVILMDSDWNPQQDLQAQDRVHRMGQERPVKILRIMSLSDMEHKMMDRTRTKLQMDGVIIQAGKFNRSSTLEQRTDLIREHMMAARETADGVPSPPTDAELNEMLARSADELALFARIDERIRTQRAERWRACGYAPDAPALLTDAEFHPDWLLPRHASKQYFTSDVVASNAFMVEPGVARSRKRANYAVDLDDDDDDDFDDEGGGAGVFGNGADAEADDANADLASSSAASRGRARAGFRAGDDDGDDEYVGRGRKGKRAAPSSATNAGERRTGAAVSVKRSLGDAMSDTQLDDDASELASASAAKRVHAGMTGGKHLAAGTVAALEWGEYERRGGAPSGSVADRTESPTPSGAVSESAAGNGADDDDEDDDGGGGGFDDGNGGFDDGTGAGADADADAGADTDAYAAGGGDDDNVAGDEQDMTVTFGLRTVDGDDSEFIGAAGDADAPVDADADAVADAVAAATGLDDGTSELTLTLTLDA